MRPAVARDRSDGILRADVRAVPEDRTRLQRADLRHRPTWNRRPSFSGPAPPRREGDRDRPRPLHPASGARRNGRRSRGSSGVLRGAQASSTLFNITRPGPFCTGGNPWMRLDVIRHRTIKGDRMRALLLLSALAAATAATLNAQVTTAKPDSGCTNYPDGRVECRVFRGGERGDSALRNKIFFRMDSAMAKRAALGLELRTTGTRRDTLGVFVEAVTPKGPAENAGIIEGDRIASINGVDLRTSAGDTEDSYTNGLAAHRLSREVQKLSPGSRVNLRVYSGGRFRDVQVTAGKASDVMRLGNRFRYMMPGMDGMMNFDGPDGMLFGPETQILRDRMEPLMRERMEPLMRERMEPMLRERLNDLPSRIQILAPMPVAPLARFPMRISPLVPLRLHRD